MNKPIPEKLELLRGLAQSISDADLQRLHDVVGRLSCGKLVRVLAAADGRATRRMDEDFPLFNSAAQQVEERLKRLMRHHHWRELSSESRMALRFTVVDRNLFTVIAGRHATMFVDEVVRSVCSDRGTAMEPADTTAEQAHDDRYYLPMVMTCVIDEDETSNQGEGDDP